jgi:hypothetical protein
MKFTSGKETVLVISDTQAPFAHPDAIAFLAALKKKYKPTEVVAIGDTLDMHTLGKWVHDPDGYGPADEYREGIKWMKELYSLFPVARETVSNHNSRYIKRIKEAGIPSVLAKDYRDVMQYPPGWSIHENIEIDGVVYEHGTRFGGTHAAWQAVTVNGQSTVFGHLHSRGAISYMANNKQLLFGMCVGCLIDHSKYAFAYSYDAKYRPILGTGIIVNGVPHFAPMELDNKARWTGFVS